MGLLIWWLQERILLLGDNHSIQESTDYLYFCVCDIFWSHCLSTYSPLSPDTVHSSNSKKEALQ